MLPILPCHTPVAVVMYLCRAAQRVNASPGRKHTMLQICATEVAWHASQLCTEPQLSVAPSGLEKGGGGVSQQSKTE